MHAPEFNAAHSRQLADFLSEQLNAMTLAQSEGYLFSVICSPEPLEVHQWLAKIVPNSDELEEGLLFSFMALYHKISEAVFGQGYTLPTVFNADYAKQWSKGFVTGSAVYAPKLLNHLGVPEEYAEALSFAQSCLSFFSLTNEGIADIAQQNKRTVNELSLQQYELMKDFSLGYAELIELVAINSGLYNDEGWD
jgi:hypothetical protein